MVAAAARLTTTKYRHVLTIRVESIPSCKIAPMAELTHLGELLATLLVGAVGNNDGDVVIATALVGHINEHTR